MQRYLSINIKEWFVVSLKIFFKKRKAFIVF